MIVAISILPGHGMDVDSPGLGLGWTDLENRQQDGDELESFQVDSLLIFLPTLILAYLMS